MIYFVCVNRECSAMLSHNVTRNKFKKSKQFSHTCNELKQKENLIEVNAIVKYEKISNEEIKKKISEVNFFIEVLSINYVFFVESKSEAKTLF